MLPLWARIRLRPERRDPFGPRPMARLIAALPCALARLPGVLWPYAAARRRAFLGLR